MIEDRTIALAQAVKARRQALGLSLDQLCARSGVSKGALVALENGDANPTFGTLVRVADALQTPISMLFNESEVDPIRVFSHASLPALWQGTHGGVARLLLTVPGAEPVEYWAWELPVGEAYVSQPHPHGVREVITVLSGILLLTVNDEPQEIPAGTTALFSADQAHRYAAAGERCEFLMQVHLPASHGVGLGAFILRARGPSGMGLMGALEENENHSLRAQYRVYRELSGRQIEFDDEILCLRAQDDTQVGCRNVTTSPGLSTQNDR